MDPSLRETGRLPGEGGGETAPLTGMKFPCDLRHTATPLGQAPQKPGWAGQREMVVKTLKVLRSPQKGLLLFSKKSQILVPALPGEQLA